MTVDELKALVKDIVRKARILKNQHTGEIEAPVNYAAVFAQSEDEYRRLLAAAHGLGTVIKQTPTGPIFHISDLETCAGPLRLLKVRAPDPARPERGNADFTVSNYHRFKQANLSRNGFGLIKRDDHEMIELVDEKHDVRVYFSYPPSDELLGVK